MSTQLERTARTEVPAVAFTQDQIELIKRQIAKGATDDELAVFLRLAEKYELDPFTREVWCICQIERDGSRKTDRSGNILPAQIMASRDGYLAIAHRHPEFDGLMADTVKEGDTFGRNPDGTVEHKYGAERGKLIGAYALVHRTDKRFPFYFFAPWSDYGKPNVTTGDGKPATWSPWFKYPHAMIVKVAEINALKRAFRISGLMADTPDVDGPPADEPELPATPPADDGEQTLLGEVA